MLKQLHCELHCVMGSDPISNPARGGGVGWGSGFCPWGFLVGKRPPPPSFLPTQVSTRCLHCLGAVVHDTVWVLLCTTAEGEGVAVVVVVDAVRVCVCVCVCVSKLCSLPHRCLAGSLLIGPELH
ncbi:unnamed protein product [Arctogadus glacialis]